MADYSWVDLQFKSQDPKIVEEVEDLVGGTDGDTAHLGEWTNIGAQTAYGYAEQAEAFLTEKGIPWMRTSDGKYEYDGDEAFWEPGMDAPRVFARLNNGGRVFTSTDIPQDATDEELGALVHEHFAFRLEAEKEEATA